MATIKFVNINKIYDNKVQAVFDFNLEVTDKEFIVFVGPSGCGKSTTLRMLAGLEDITSGELYIDDVLVNDMPPKDRNIAMVFQSYALYPHMTVYNNMAFALQLKKVPKEEIDKRVNEAAAILGLEPYLQRKPKALSGGQRQRVALGRAIVRSPKVFLMDEPLSNLDAKLRVQMRAEIAKIHEKVGATTVYVTHDQTEAMTMATRIVVMKDGKVQQIGTPKEVYDHPVNMFVGGFIGSPAMNFFNGTVKDGKFVFDDENGDVSIALDKQQTERLAKYNGSKVVLGVRPEDILLSSGSGQSLKVACDVVELLGHELILYANIGTQRVVFRTSSKQNVRAHDEVNITFNAENVHFFDPETTMVI
ncbi:MAG: sn-glycerol-3-phosphate ABC transporter ATP-binding protein UgpC [Clostridia bacterium]|nr:sn-glycerol-3-phosphate ABC transporter ATP-binding protein UgpC [Clostridia bacterium]